MAWDQVPALSLHSPSETQVPLRAMNLIYKMVSALEKSHDGEGDLAWPRADLHLPCIIPGRKTKMYGCISAASEIKAARDQSLLPLLVLGVLRTAQPRPAKAGGLRNGSWSVSQV